MLKDKRLDKGLSQSQLSKKSGVNKRMIQNYEQGVRNINGAKLSTLVDLAIALEVPIIDILSDEELVGKCKKVSLK